MKSGAEKVSQIAKKTQKKPAHGIAKMAKKG